jgi:hypothetical protein
LLVAKKSCLNLLLNETFFLELLLH